MKLIVSSTILVGVLFILWNWCFSEPNDIVSSIKVNPRSALGYATLTNLKMAGIHTSIDCAATDGELAKRESDIKRVQETWLPTIADPDIRANYASWLDYAQSNVIESRKHLSPELSGIGSEDAAAMAAAEILRGALPKPPENP